MVWCGHLNSSPLGKSCTASNAFQCFYCSHVKVTNRSLFPFSIPYSTSPIDWFEITMTITLQISVYIKVGLFLGFFEVTLYEQRFTYSQVILGPIKYTPKPFREIATLNKSSGRLSIVSGDVTCARKGGSVGDEELQCWESKKAKPVIRTFKAVKSLGVSRSNVNALSFTCIQSESQRSE